MSLTLSKFDSPLGEMHLVTDSGDVLHALEFADRPGLAGRLRMRFGALPPAAPPAAVAEVLRRYFRGRRDALIALRLAAAGGEFERRVLGALRRIPVGETTSYGELARSLGCSDPRAAIDVGAAAASNPIALAVPCHRLIGKGGDLKGYAWGSERKRWLLEHEGALRHHTAEMAF